MKKGFIATTVVLIISAIVIAVAVTVTMISIGEVQTTFSLVSGENTLGFVEGCMEDALLKARNSSAYAGGNITRPEGTCTVTITKAGNQWTITSGTIATDYIRTVQVVATRTGNGMVLSSWKEL